MDTILMRAALAGCDPSAVFVVMIRSVQGEAICISKITHDQVLAILTTHQITTAVIIKNFEIRPIDYPQPDQLATAFVFELKI